MKRTGPVWIVIFIALMAQGQDIKVTLTPNPILIGDHMELTIRAKNAGNMSFPTVNDTTMGNFRLVESHKPDTLFSGSDITIFKKYIITCFEDSTQVFPSLSFHQGLSSIYHSNPITITVNSPNVDTAKEIKPIKSIILVPLTKAEIFSYLLSLIHI